MLTLLAPAKINATLEILTRREDGYHTLRSVMLPVALYDRITIAPAERNSFSVNDSQLAHGNLVERALAATGVTGTFAVTLEKRIPVGGGLGGGSSDAAAVLLSAMRGDLGAHGDVDWLALARALGSDIPFFLCETGALVEGTGDRVTPLGAMPPWWFLIVRPHASVATAEAYRILDATREVVPAPSRPRGTSDSLAVVDAVQRSDFAAFRASLVNDFHAPIRAQYPAVAAADAAMRDAGATVVLLSGSGSCLFAPFATEAEARAVRADLPPHAIEAAFAVPLHAGERWR